MKRNLLVMVLILALSLAWSLEASAAVQRNKLIFISDIHMNYDANYSWFKNPERIGALADFLNSIAAREDVAELIILGDLVDDWVFPMSQQTAQTFQPILEEDINQPVLDALKLVCDNPNIAVVYVVGNHDMLLYQSANMQYLQSRFPQMTIVADEPGLGSYSKNQVLWAEHGHRYCMFNSPDTWSNPGSHLPLGYFITRAIADKSAVDGVVIEYPEILAQTIQANAVIDETMPKLVYETVALVYTGHSLDDPNRMGGLDGFTPDPTVGWVADAYEDIFREWSARQNIVYPEVAAINDTGTLVVAAAHLFLWPTEEMGFTPRIIIFGHTHNAGFHHFLTHDNNIYINTGTWIDTKSPTYAEITVDEQTSETVYTAALWYYGEASPRHQADIIIPAAGE